MTAKDHAVIYVRPDFRTSVAEATREASAYAEHRGWNITATVTEEADKATAEDRPGLIGVLEAAAMRSLDKLVVPHIDHLGPPHHAGKLIEHLADRGVSIEMTNGFSTTTRLGQFGIWIMVSVGPIARQPAGMETAI